MDVYRIVEHKDGSSRIFFSGINKEIKSLIKQQYGAKKFTRAIFKRFVMDALSDRSIKRGK
jgi:hypothetical protein